MSSGVRLEAWILGASGFGGGELMRLLLAHPQLNAVHAISRSHVGKAIGQVHPHLRPLSSQHFLEQLDLHALHQAPHPVVFAALPHGEFAKLWPELRAQLPSHCCVIDLSADFRLNDAASFAKAYGYAHPCPEFLSEFIYGLAELRRTQLLGARRIANPGCFATALNLALLPLAGLGPLPIIHVSAVTGSSGSGASPGSGTHHPTRAHDFRAYKVLAHQHQSEISACLASAAAPGEAPEFTLVAHSAPMVRGIFCTAQLRWPADARISAAGLSAHYQQFYQHSRFVQVLDESPRVAAVAGSNFSDISVHHQGSDVAILCALDNLGQGMAGQAVQNMNLAFGLNESAGLLGAALMP